MDTPVVVPEVGEGGMEVTFVQWLRSDGDEVREGEDLFELDTEKTTLVVEAVASGVLCDVKVAAGDIVEPRQVLATIRNAGETTV